MYKSMKNMEEIKKILSLMERIDPNYKKVINVRLDIDKNPSDAQIKAGNYKKGHINILGFEITIENPKGSIRSGTDSNGKKWSVKMNNDYGYFTKTLGKDGDHIDVFIGSKLNSDKIYVVDQVDNHGDFDESKVMLGFDNEKDAKNAYMNNYSKGWKGFKKITEINIDMFKTWLYDGKRQYKPFYEYKKIKDSLKNN